MAKATALPYARVYTPIAGDLRAAGSTGPTTPAAPRTSVYGPPGGETIEGRDEPGQAVAGLIRHGGADLGDVVVDRGATVFWGGQREDGGDDCG